MGVGVVSKEEFSQFIFNPYLEWFIMLCIYIVLFSGVGRRCRCAGNAEAP